jgi:hypothetical protein
MRSLRFLGNNSIGEGVEILATIQVRIQQRLLGGFILQSINLIGLNNDYPFGCTTESTWKKIEG